MDDLDACMSMYHFHGCYLWRVEKGIGSSGIDVMNGCEPPCESWGLNFSGSS